MANTTSTRPSIARLILVPSVITLAITILRLVGELQRWSSPLFSPTPEGAGAIVGITWLAPIFGIYFALKLAGAGRGPAHVGRAIGIAFVGLIIMVGGFFLFNVISAGLFSKLTVVWGLVALSGAIQLAAWPALFKTLLAYGYAARIPVAIVMFFAMRGNWGTHYDWINPQFPLTTFWARYIWLGLIPQLVLWITFTILTGTLFGSIATAIVYRRKPTPVAAP